MSGRRFARRNLFSKLHFQFSLQGEKIITLDNNLQKKKKRELGFIVPTQMKMRRLDWTEVGAALHETWAHNTDETQNHTCLVFFLQKTKLCFQTILSEFMMQNIQMCEIRDWQRDSREHLTENFRRHWSREQLCHCHSDIL